MSDRHDVIQTVGTLANVLDNRNGEKVHSGGSLPRRGPSNKSESNAPAILQVQAIQVVKGAIRY